MGLLAFAPLAWAAVCDGMTRRVPNAAVSLLLVCGLGRVLCHEMTPQDALCGLLFLGLTLLLCALLLSGGTAIGGGDVKLCAAAGFLLGPILGGLAVAAALLLLSAVGCARRTKSLPFAPFLLPTYLIFYIWS